MPGGRDGRSVNTTNIGKRTTKLGPTVNERRSEVKSTPALKPTAESSKQARPKTAFAQPSPQPVADRPLQTELQSDSWDQLRDWLQRRIQARGREAVWSELRSVLETLDFPIETIADETGKVSFDKTSPKKTADVEPPAPAVVEDWISVRL